MRKFILLLCIISFVFSFSDTKAIQIQPFNTNYIHDNSDDSILNEINTPSPRTRTISYFRFFSALGLMRGLNLNLNPLVLPDSSLEMKDSEFRTLNQLFNTAKLYTDNIGRFINNWITIFFIYFF